MTCDFCLLVSIALKEDTMNELGSPNVYRHFWFAFAIATENYWGDEWRTVCYTVCNHFVPNKTHPTIKTINVSVI